MHKLKIFNIPNIITIMNLICGSIACILLTTDNKYNLLPIFFIILSLIFDFLDGFVARLLSSFSLIGKDLDSLADLISFGLFPSIITYKMLFFLSSYILFIDKYLLLIPSFLILIFSAIRLAKFNVDQRSSNYFYGLNVPSNTFLWIGFYSFFFNNKFSFLFIENNAILIYIIIILLIFLSCFLMISDIKMVSNKSLKDNKFFFILLLLLTFILFYFINFVAFSISIIIYIIYSILTLNIKKT